MVEQNKNKIPILRYVFGGFTLLSNLLLLPAIVSFLGIPLLIELVLVGVAFVAMGVKLWRDPLDALESFAVDGSVRSIVGAVGLLFFGIGSGSLLVIAPAIAVIAIVAFLIYAMSK